MVLLTLTSLGFTRVQNQLAHLVTRSPPFTRSIPLLRSLRWLPVRFGILYKINLLTYKTLRAKTACLSSFEGILSKNHRGQNSELGTICCVDASHALDTVHSI